MKRPRFDGDDYVRPRDDKRLVPQYDRIWNCMVDGQWRTLVEIAALTGDPPASISAQLRHMRKDRFGAHTVNRRHRGDEGTGLYEYQLIPNPNPPGEEEEPAVFISSPSLEDDKTNTRPLVQSEFGL